MFPRNIFFQFDEAKIKIFLFFIVLYLLLVLLLGFFLHKHFFESFWAYYVALKFNSLISIAVEITWNIFVLKVNFKNKRISSDYIRRRNQKSSDAFFVNLFIVFGNIFNLPNNPLTVWGCNATANRGCYRTKTHFFHKINL